MVNFSRAIRQPGRLARCRTTVMLPVNNLPAIRIGSKESSQILGLAPGSSKGPSPAYRELLLDDRRSLRLRPSEMLPAVESDHLTGHRWRRQYEAQRRRNLLWAGAAAQRHRRALPVEFLRALPWAWQCRTGSDAVNPDARRQS